MTITQDQFIQLSRIYNTLLGIETRGENTMAMCDCLRAYQTIINDLQKQLQPAPAVETEEVTD